MKTTRVHNKKKTRMNVYHFGMIGLGALLVLSLFAVHDLRKDLKIEQQKAVTYYDVAYAKCNITTIKIDNDDSVIIDGSRIENVELLQTKDGANRKFTLNHNYIEKISYCPKKDTEIKELNCISSAIITPNIPKETVKTIEGLLCKNAQVMYLNTREGVPYAN